MMKLKLFGYSLVLAASLRLQVSVAQNIHVTSLNSDFDAKALAQNKGIVDRPRPVSEDILQPLAPGLRDELIEKAGLTADLSLLDELDKDFFVVRARNGSMERLIRHYPNISKNKLVKLQVLLKNLGEEEKK